MRSAPAPDLLPIPGMNQGTAVAAGSGGSGGGDGNAGDGGDGEGAGGGQGGNDANGGGNGAGQCGAGSSGGCPRHKPSASAGDPIDPCTGDVFTEAVRDFELAGNLPIASCHSLHLDRMYKTSSRKRDVGFGHGWTHTFAQELDVGRATILLWMTSGSYMTFPALDVGERVIGQSGYLLERRSDDVYVLDCRDYRRRFFTHVGGDPRRRRLTAVTDWNGNRCTVTYRDGVMAQVDDAVSRSVRFVPDGRGHISRVEITDPITQANLTLAEYEYDEAGNLVLNVDADGNRRRYTYDQSHRLTSHTSPDGLTFRFLYDAKGRCVETWGEYDDGRREPALAEDAPRLLADGTTRVRGIYHVKVVYGARGYSECIDATQAKRYFANKFGSLDKAITGQGVITRTFDSLGFETSVTDPSGATWTTERDERGRELRLVDPTGATKSISRNDEGRPTRIVDEYGGVTTYEYDARGNKIREVDPLGAVTSFEYDDRGLLTRRIGANGSVRVYVYDARANLIELHRANGAVWRFEYDGLGSLTARVAPSGGRREYARSLRGDPRSKRDEHGNVWQYETNYRRELTRSVEPNGGSFDVVYSGVGWVARTERPNGRAVRFFYDGDGHPVQITNAKGEIGRFEWGADGQIKKEVTFDGRVFHYRRDARGLVTRMTTEHGDVQTCEYDERGLKIKVTDQDDNAIEYAYDAGRLLIGASDPSSRVTLTRDVLGNITRDAQSLDGEEISVSSVYDTMGNVIAVESSLGYRLDIERDSMGERKRVRLDGNWPVSIDYDICALEIARRLPGGGVIEIVRDAEGRPIKQAAVGSPSAGRPDGEPQWVGRSWLGPGETAYRWSPSGELVGLDGQAGTTTLEYDASGRLLAYEAPDRSREQFHYDLTDNPHAQGLETVYGKGDRLLRRGRTDYVWNDGGRLTEKHVRNDGPTGVDVWRYKWLSTGLLGSVERPDGGLVEFRYDSFARRLEKVVRRRDSTTVEKTRYVWNYDWLLQEVTTRSDGNKKGVRVRQRDYCYGPGMAVTAHADVAFDPLGNPSGRTWCFYLSDPLGFPEKLVDGGGNVVASLQRSAFGSVSYAPGARTSTPIRKIGQYHDEETGLTYNRWRYYDAETGRFISPDPLGLRGGLNGYSAGLNPIRWDDPLGLATELSDRTADLRNNMPMRRNCMAVGVVGPPGGGPPQEVWSTMNRNGNTPSPNVRDGSDWPNQRVPGQDPPGAVTQDEFQPTQGTGEAGCDHAEQRMIRAAEARGLQIQSISATNNCCDNCHDALIEHNPNVQIADPNGNQVHP